MSDSAKVIAASVSPDERTLTVIYDEPVGDRFDDGLTVLPGDDHRTALRRQIIITSVFVTTLTLIAVAVVLVFTGPDAVQWVLPTAALVVGVGGVIAMLAA